MKGADLSRSGTCVCSFLLNTSVNWPLNSSAFLRSDWATPFPFFLFRGGIPWVSIDVPIEVGWLCWGLTSQSTIFQSCWDGAIASWVINQYFRGVKCLAQGHNTAEVGLEPRTSRSGVRHSTTEPPRSPPIEVSGVCLNIINQVIHMQIVLFSYISLDFSSLSFKFWSKFAAACLFCLCMSFIFPAKLSSYLRCNPGNWRDRPARFRWDIFIRRVLNKRS